MTSSLGEFRKHSVTQLCDMNGRGRRFLLFCGMSIFNRDVAMKAQSTKAISGCRPPNRVKTSTSRVVPRGNQRSLRGFLGGGHALGQRRALRCDGRKHAAHVARNSPAPPTTMRSVAAMIRSLCVLGALQRAHVPRMCTTSFACGRSASKGAKRSPKWSRSQPAMMTETPRSSRVLIGATTSDAKKWISSIATSDGAAGSASTSRSRSAASRADFAATRSPVCVTIAAAA